MKKSSLILLIFLAVTALKAQVGVNTESPQGVFHIDAARNTSGNTNVADDVVVDAQGRVGVGTNNPTNKLSVHTTGDNTGLYLPNGSASGRVLTSDAQGNGVWVSGAVQYQTMVESTGGRTFFTITNPSSSNDNMKLDFFKNVLFDKAKQIYGDAYGWSVENQQYVCPVDGVYRIAMNMYYQSGDPGQNNRIYIYLNGAIYLVPGLISVTDTGSDQSAYIMGLASLKKGDILDFRAYVQGNYWGTPQHTSILWGGPGTTFILIESL
ncbi:hypothetical protein [Dysgonomonas sp. 520]|uniref:hypothetical protein n=1 Tax=Dysgonomonas sp. 520 TaxID=2302931 RepID=UPI0013D11DDF|nr:hypothetical protein [Dysgonomonas sp. 520]NDW10585.1 hypothetical protein [Dysgonomonas sp. 520]